MTIPVSQVRAATPPVRRVCLGLNDRFGDRIVGLGVSVCRNIAGTNTPSQHAWGNAVDVGGPTAVLDQVARWARHPRRRDDVSQVLWRVAGHFDHVHISGRPYREGVPPCMRDGGGGQEGPHHRGRPRRTLPSPRGAVRGETWVGIANASARQLSRSAERIGRAAGAIHRTMRGGR